jgi:hypothetical protein
MKVQSIHKLVGIPETASDYYDKKTLPQCKIHLETHNFVVFLWNRGYYGAGGDCSYTRVYIVHPESQEWCELIELDQTWGDAWYKFDEIQDQGDYLEVKISGHCHGDYTATVDYDRDIFEAHLSGSGKLTVLRKKNPVVEEEQRIAAEKESEKKREWMKKEVAIALQNADVSDINLHAITEFRMNGIWKDFIKVISPDLVICDGHRSLDSGSAGMGYFSQIRVWYKGQTDMKEWQWRDCYSASRDRHDLYINGVGEVEVQPKNGKVEIRIELLNREYGSRYATFSFEEKLGK